VLFFLAPHWVVIGACGEVVHEDLPWVRVALMPLKDAGVILKKGISNPLVSKELMLPSSYGR